MELSEIITEKQKLEARIMDDINSFFKNYPDIILTTIEVPISNLALLVEIENDGTYTRPGISDFKLICQII